MERSYREPFHLPVSRQEVLAVADRLLAGDLTREDASIWAWQALPAVEAQSSDELVEETLDCLLAIDQVQVESATKVTGYLFDFVELQGLRDKLAESEALLSDLPDRTEGLDDGQS